MIRITDDLDATTVVERRCRSGLHVDVSIETWASCGEATMERTTCARHPRMVEFGAPLDHCSNPVGHGVNPRLARHRTMVALNDVARTMPSLGSRPGLGHIFAGGDLIRLTLSASTVRSTSRSAALTSAALDLKRLMDAVASSSRDVFSLRGLWNSDDLLALLPSQPQRIHVLKPLLYAILDSSSLAEIKPCMAPNIAAGLGRLGRLFDSLFAEKSPQSARIQARVAPVRGTASDVGLPKDLPQRLRHRELPFAWGHSGIRLAVSRHGCDGRQGRCGDSAPSEAHMAGRRARAQRGRSRSR